MCEKLQNLRYSSEQPGVVKENVKMTNIVSTISKINDISPISAGRLFPMFNASKRSFRGIPRCEIGWVTHYPIILMPNTSEEYIVRLDPQSGIWGLNKRFERGGHRGSGHDQHYGGR
jgi:hypothetical protein